MKLYDILNYIDTNIKIHVKRIICNKPCETLFHDTVTELFEIMKDTDIPFLHSNYFIITADIVGSLDFPNTTYIQPSLIIYVMI